MTTNTTEKTSESDVPLPTKKLLRVESVLKFGDQYKAAQIQQFSDYYIDYESLKTLLHDQFTSEAHMNEPLRKKRLVFLQALLKEISGVDNFHGERLRKYNEQHLRKLLPANFDEWKANQRAKQKAYLESKEQEKNLQLELEKNGGKAQSKTNDGESGHISIDGTTQQESDGETFSNMDLEDALMAIDENETTDDRKKDANGQPIEHSITSKDVTMAIRALSRLLLFWKQNELAIFNIVKKYETYSGESIQPFLKIGPQASASNFTLPMLPKVTSGPIDKATAEAMNVPEPIIGSTDPNKGDNLEYQKKLKQDVLRVSQSIERYKRRRDTTEAEIEKLNNLQNTLAEKEPMPVSELELSQFFVEDPVATVTELPIDACDPGTITRLWLEIVNDPLSPIKIPVFICKGTVKGPIVGITAALHGNEVNGVSVIHQLVRAINVEELSGVIVAVPVANPPGFIARTRNFSSGQDLNRCFPGQKNGYRGNQYAWYFTERFVRKITHLIDLHTASHGRQNSLYVRTDMTHSVCKQMALLQAPQIIVHNAGSDGSLREAAMSLGKPAITVEIGNPSSFQKTYIMHTLQGVENVLSYLGMIHESVETPEVFPTICVKSHWYYAEHGGTLQMKPTVNQWVKKGEVIAVVRNIFGDLVHRYVAHDDGVVIGRNVDPVCQSGDRLILLGTVGRDFAQRTKTH